MPSLIEQLGLFVTLSLMRRMVIEQDAGPFFPVRFTSVCCNLLDQPRPQQDRETEAHGTALESRKTQPPACRAEFRLTFLYCRPGSVADGFADPIYRAGSSIGAESTKEAELHMFPGGIHLYGTVHRDVTV